jgi:hypothetical protein
MNQQKGYTLTLQEMSQTENFKASLAYHQKGNFFSATRPGTSEIQGIIQESDISNRFLLTVT